eukprot:CAMPEP_0116890596 /NCGR_PEP_ID=MMETSP0467-20121206/1124_1 /TAXON_ID=283647 /ORGANISM="Mesodinium pulex, Strain SPMC105" /LENGTH=79 /DNA_ID=CAMNT_0004558493 /DNA_START=1193 /DNA_END=1432 /DNA_ORIENTATION=-
MMGNTLFSLSLVCTLVRLTSETCYANSATTSANAQTTTVNQRIISPNLVQKSIDKIVPFKNAWSVTNLKLSFEVVFMDI